MPGMRLFNYRQGDRTEYLAQYLLSALGIAVPVPRQEDVGIDFHCSLARMDTESRLTFFAPFNVQIKSAGPTSVTYGGLKSNGDWKGHEIEWLLCQTVPFFIALVDKSSQKLDMFCTSTRWFAKYHRLKPAAICFEFYSRSEDDELGNGHKTPLRNAVDLNLPSNVEPAVWTFPVGQPVLSLSIAETEDRSTIDAKIQCLATFVAAEAQNVVLGETGQAHFRWPLFIRTNQPLREQGIWIAWPTTVGDATRAHLRMITPVIAALMKTFEAESNWDSLRALGSVVPLLPRDPDLNMPHKLIADALAAIDRAVTDSQ